MCIRDRFGDAATPPGRVESGLGHGSPLDEEGLDKFAAAAMKGAGLTEKG